MTSLVGGMLKNGMSVAFAAVGDIVANAGNHMSGSLQMTSNGQPETMKQVTEQVAEVRRSGIMISTLNSAQQGIIDSLHMVGDVTKGVLDIEGNYDTNVIGEFGRLMDRIANGSGTYKPTPLALYASMVTKRMATSADIV